MRGIKYFFQFAFADLRCANHESIKMAINSVPYEEKYLKKLKC